MNAPAVSEYVRPADADAPDGIYRVVGVDDEAVRLLEVADGDGRRTHTGRVITVARDDLDGFEAAGRPRDYPTLRSLIASELAILYWSTWAFLGQLVAHPRPTVAGAAVLAAGVLGDRYLAGPDLAFAAAIVVGSVVLAYVGSGRLSR